MAVDRDGDGPPLRREDTPQKPVGRDELRATAFTDDVFDDDYYGRQRRKKSGRSLNLAVGIVLGLAIAGGAGWYVFRGEGFSFTPGAPQTIKAEETPYKIKPENPGGMQVENQDKLVYDRVAKGAAPNRVENLLPPPEEPKAPPQKPKITADDQKAMQDAVRAVTAEPAKPEAAKPVPPAAEPPKPAPEPAKQVAEAAKPAEPAKPAPEPPKVATEPPKPEPAKPEPAKTEAPKTDPLAEAVVAAAGGKTSASGPIDTGTPATAADKPAPPSPAPPEVAAVTPSAAAPRAYQVQLVSVPSEEAANAEWARLSKRHGELFANLTHAITKADLGERGVYYRLRVGPLADKAAADALCAALANEKTGCIPVRP
jgi:hypothetical protein